MDGSEPQIEQDNFEYAGFWLRVLASLIDTLLFGLLVLPVFALTLSDAQWSTVHSEGGQATSLSIQALQVPGGVNLVVNYILPAVVIMLFWIYKSATPGKLLLKLRIVDAKTGGKPSTSQWFLRYLGYYLSMMVFFLGFIWVGLDRRKQGWHDKLATTVVIRKKGRASVQFES